MRVVIDTNVMVSGVLGGSVGAVLDHWRLGRFTLVVTDAIVGEYLEVLRRPKFALPPDVVDTIIGYVFHKAEFVYPSERVAVITADPKDNQFLEAAVAGNADSIVSGDQHLLSLGSFRGTPIITARGFLERLEAISKA